MADAPDGYAFDFVNSDVVLHELSFKDGRLVTPGGTSYRILYLGGRSQRMTLPVLRQPERFGRAGRGGGRQPAHGFAQPRRRRRTSFSAIADQLWGKKACTESAAWCALGREESTSAASANEVLAALGVARDFEYTKPEPDANLMFVHRKLADGDVYFVDNRNDRAENVNAMFRVDGKAPELWDAASGTTQPASYSIADGRTTVPLHLEPYGTTFVVFREPAKTAVAHLA